MAFVKVIEKGSFQAAAKDLRVSASVVSKQLRLLEEDMGVLLLRRSTRRLSLTDPGQLFHEQCAAALSSIRTAKELVTEEADASRGVISIQSTLSISVRVLAPAIRAFAELHPNVSFKVTAAEEPARVIDSGYDIVMIHRPTTREKSVSCRTFRPVRFLICASQDYLDRHGAPSKPSDLANFNCLVNEKQLRPNEWRFRGSSSEQIVKVKGNLRMNDSIALTDAVLNGMGIGRLPDYHVESELQGGRLRVLFDNVIYDVRTITAAFPRTRYTPPRVILFLEFLERFLAEKGEPSLQRAAL